MSFPTEFSYDGTNAWFGKYKDANWSQTIIIRKYNTKLTLYGKQSEPYNIEPQIGPRTVPVCKSNLQKCIRRQDSDRAVKTALAMYSYSPSELLRRIPVIFTEDCLLHPPTFIKVTWWMAAVSKGFKLSKKELEVLMGIIVLMCESKNYDVCQIENKYEYAHDKLTSNQRDFLFSLELRIHYGGLEVDKKMLSYHIGLWFHRFQEKDKNENNQNWWEKICSQAEYEVDLDSIDKLSRDDLLLESFDHHCYPFIISKMTEKYDLSFEDVKSAIWDCRSRINYRIPNEDLFRQTSKNTQENYNKFEKDLLKLTHWLKARIILTE